MTDANVLAVGGPPTFRFQVARALQQDVDGVEWTATVSAAESAIGEGKSLPNVVVVATAVKDLDAFGLAEFVGSSAPAAAILLIRDTVANGLLPLAMRAGIREVVDLSRGGEELKEALARAIRWSQNLLTVQGSEPDEADGPRAKVISVFSSKGGTGKTFLSTGLAVALAKETGKDTALLDLEFGVGDTLSYFGKEPSRALQDLVSVGDLDDRDAIHELAVKPVDHLSVYAAPSDPSVETPSGEAIGKVISTLRRTFDYLVIDGTANYTDPALAAFDLSDSVCLITGLDVVGVRHLSTGLRTLLSLGLPNQKFRFVLNRAGSKVGLSVETVERIMKLKVDGMIPSSRLVPTALNEGHTVLEQYPHSDVAKAIVKLAHMLVDIEQPVPAKRRLFARS